MFKFWDQVWDQGRTAAWITVPMIGMGVMSPVAIAVEPAVPRPLPHSTSLSLPPGSELDGPVLMAQVQSPLPTATTVPQTSIRYYQDYQAAPTQPSAQPLPIGGPTLPTAAAPVQSGIAPTTTPQSLTMPNTNNGQAQFGAYWLPYQTNPIAPAPSTAQSPAIAPAAPAPSSPSVQLGTVAEVRIDGATPELERIIREIIQTEPGSPTTTGQIQSDVSAILGTGLFTNAFATPQTVNNGVIVVYQVEPTFLQQVRLVGNEVLPSAIAASAFQGQVGQPVSPTSIQQGIERINQWYSDNGYSLAQVVTLLVEPSGVLTLEVVEGQIGQVDIQFVDPDTGEPVDEDGDPVEGRTRESFLREEIQLQAGEPFREDVARRDVQRLAALGLFSQIDLAVINQGQTVDVTYLLAEVPSRSFNFGGGINSGDGLFVSVTYQDRNFGGVGDRLSLNTQIGQTIQFGAGFTSPYRDSRPDELGWRVNVFQRRFTSRSFTDEVELPNGDTAREGRLGGSAAVMRPLGEWDAELGVNYTRVSIREEDGDLAPVDELGNPLTFSDSGIDDLFTLSFSATRDRRDNPINPTTGSALTLSTEQSIPIGNGSILMNRLQANYATYVPVEVIGTGDVDNPEVLAVNVQGGTILGDAPPYDSFNLGGANSVRGYREGRVGTGRHYFLVSTEYRFPMFEPVSGVLFADFASDLGSGSSILGEPAEVRDKPGTGFGYGFGVRVNTPLGLIRADFGLNDQGDNRFHFGFGQRF